MFSEQRIDRRRLVRGFLAALVVGGPARAARSRANPLQARVVRISRASFPSESFDDVRRRLESAEQTLVPAIGALSGCLHYFAAIDRESASMVNVSVWRSLADAKQMQTLAPMLALAEEFTRLGVRFERPVINYETLWQA